MTLPGNFIDARHASDAVQAWAAGEPALAGLLASGMTMVQATARWGLHLLKANRAADAVAVFRAAVALLPSDPCLWLDLGIALDRAGSPADAAGCLDRSLALSHHQPDTWTLLGVARGKLGDRRGAEAAYRAALALAPASLAAWQCLGMLKEQERDCAGAIECFRTCVGLGQPSAAIWANLGRLYYQIGSFLEAYGAYEAAVRAEPTNTHYAHMLRRAQFLRDVFEGASVDDALATYERSASKSEESDRDRLDLLEVASGLFGHAGHTDAAIRISRKRLELRPESAAAKYLLSALVDEPGVDRSPPDYIVENFDAFAEQFDAKLVGVLGYDVPEQLCALARDVTAVGHLYDVLDAGCGTGLCGPLLQSLARNLTGVDLSSKMLELAGRRGVYDALFREELTTFLGHSPERFDLIVAADVLIYFGDLTEVLALAAAAIRPGGHLVFSTELLRGDGYRILPTGRFAHSPGYVQAAAAPRFAQERCVETTLRLDTSVRVPGHLFAFRRLG
ncbi:MAG TPA: methyltransferase domain-containing protein [Polyangiaceae bacterium]|nr:methyltransferase domain-containing protein [Polyangiaceae bacterium]